ANLITFQFLALSSRGYRTLLRTAAALLRAFEDT
ncbi:MAG: hypothetical protein ACI88G_000381, partial [Woeseiaceae bacterium]